MIKLYNQFVTITGISWLTINHSDGGFFTRLLKNIIDSEVIQEMVVVLITGVIFVLVQQAIAWVRRKFGDKIHSSIDEDLDELEEKLKELRDKTRGEGKDGKDGN